MIKGIGVDITELSRIKDIMAKGEEFAQKVLTIPELDLYRELSGDAQVRFLAGRFSIKESFAKALGTGIGASVGLQEIETLPNESGQPITTSTRFSGKIHASISHSESYVISEILLEEN